VKPGTAAGLAATLEQLAAALREEGQDAPPLRLLKLRAASVVTGIPASTLRELCASRAITATRMGRDWMLRLSDIEQYQKQHEWTARGPLLRMSR
jgi:excisionase family DNA binding protein